MWEIIIIILLILVLGVVLFLVFREKKGNTEEYLENALYKTWLKVGLGEKIALIAEQASEIKKSYQSFDQLLRIPTERGNFGEISLETILSDQLPAEMFGLQKQVLEGKKPDAYIKSTVGIICIDSKFPLDNYRKFVECEDPQEKSNFKKAFKDDVEKQLKKIADDYVCPLKGSAEFAFAYIPVESVAYYLQTEESELLLKMVKKGVQVLSPLTLSQKVELIKAGVYALRLSENAKVVRNEILNLGSSFKKVDEIWKVLYETHIKNVNLKADELDSAYRKLKEKFENIQSREIDQD